MSEHNHGTITEIINSTVYDKTESGYTITIVKTTNWADRDTYTPAIGSAHPTATAYTLKQSKQEQLPGGFAKITLSYVAANDSLPASTVVEQGSVIQAPIQEHPDFASWSDDWDDENQRFLSSSNKAGITSYLVPTKIVIKTTYYASKPSDPTGEIGTKENPGGDFTGSAGKWLLIGADRKQIGNYWCIERTYQYSSKPYNDDVYPD